MKLDKFKLWDDDYENTEIPKYEVVNLHQNSGGYNIIDGYEASAYVGTGQFSMIAHISIYPDGVWEDATGGQSSRTLRGLEILLCPAP